jgi:iron(III) transport system substrate-binding protein
MIFPTEGVIFVPSPTAVIRGAAHPNAARLLAQFMLTREVQLMMVAAGFHASRRDLPPPKGMPGLTEIKSIPVDYAYIEDHGRELKAKFGEIFQ